MKPSRVNIVYVENPNDEVFATFLEWCSRRATDHLGSSKIFTIIIKSTLESFSYLKRAQSLLSILFLFYLVFSLHVTLRVHFSLLFCYSPNVKSKCHLVSFGKWSLIVLARQIVKTCCFIFFYIWKMWLFATNHFGFKENTWTVLFITLSNFKNVST